MTFKKGDVRPVLAGRKSKIKTPLATEMSRKTIAHALEGHSFKIKMALDRIFEEDAKLYIDAISKLMNYAVPKLSSTEIKDNTSKKIEVKLGKDATVDDIRKQLEDIKNLEKPSESEVLDAVRTLLRWTGDNPDRDGLKDTPKRVLKAYGVNRL